jgi:NTE family protein
MVMKIGLALGGGGARGGAHLGVLYELRALGLKPDLITGTSIGGLVGAFAATGMEVEVIEDFLREISLSSLLTLPSSSQPSLIGNSKGRSIITNFIGSPTFSDLKIPTAVVTVDLVSRHQVILDEGDLVTALLATTAFPIIAPPVEIEGMVLVDGGLINNVPFDVARARGATHVIAVDIGHSAPFGQQAQDPPQPMPGLLGKAISVTQQRPIWQVVAAVADIVAANGVNGRLAISPPDIMIQPKNNRVGMFDFHRMDESIEAGRKAARAVAPELEKLVTMRAKLRG